VQVAWVVALACCVAFALLGNAVAARPPGALDRWGLNLRGYGFAIAVFLTRSGRWYGIVTVAVIFAIVAAALHVTLNYLVELVVVQLLAQGAVNGIKLLYRRARPDDPLHRFERGHSYPSGHAATAIVFFLGLLLLVSGARDLPPAFQAAAVVVLALFVAGIPWSRLALGAHYITDVAGGLLFGGAWLAACIGVAGVLHVHPAF